MQITAAVKYADRDTFSIEQLELEAPRAKEILVKIACNFDQNFLRTWCLKLKLLNAERIAICILHGSSNLHDTLLFY